MSRAAPTAGAAGPARPGSRPRRWCRPSARRAGCRARTARARRRSTAAACPGAACSSSSGRPASTPQCGPRNLYGEHAKKSAPSASHVDRCVRGVVHAVDVEPGAGGVDAVGDRREVGHGADQVGGRGDRDEPGAVGEQRRDRSARRRARRSPGRSRPSARSRRPRSRGDHPRPDVGVVVEPGDHDLVAGPPAAAPGCGPGRRSAGSCCGRRRRRPGRRRAGRPSRRRGGHGVLGVALGRRSPCRGWRAEPVSASSIARATTSGVCEPPGPSKCAAPSPSPSASWGKCARTRVTS